MKADAFRKTEIASNPALSFSPENLGSPLDEDYFHQVLALERKRAERSGNPSLLLNFDFRNFHSGPKRNQLARTFQSFLPTMIRETDLVGWYESAAIIGIIFTELGDSELEEAKDKIIEKAQCALRDSLGPSESKLIKISFEFLMPKCLWSRNGNGQLHLQPIPPQSADDCSGSRLFKVDGLPLKTSWFLICSDLLFISIGHLLAIWILTVVGWTVFFKTYAAACSFSILLYPVTMYVFDLYNLEKIGAPRQTAFRITLAGFPVIILCTILFNLTPDLHYSRDILASQVILSAGFLILWRTIYGSYLFQTAKSKLPALILGSGETAKKALRLLNTRTSPFEFKGFVDNDASWHSNDNGAQGTLGPIKQLSELTLNLKIKALILAIPRSRSNRITRKILEARMSGIEVIDMPSLYEQLADRVPVKYIEDQWLLFSNGFYLISRQYMQKIKRLLDFFFSTLLLFCFSPIMILTAIAIRIDSPGPVFYKQQRVGKGCRVFTVHKFRSMCYNAEEHGARWAQKKDPRVTRVGKWIRLFRIDELPQIWNVFTGDMSLVGPRPERPEFVKELDSQIPYYTVRHTVPPGITGWAQIKYPYGASIEDALRKLEYDLYYIKNMSLLLDLKILLRTVGVVLLGEGAR